MTKRFIIMIVVIRRHEKFGRRSPSMLLNIYKTIIYIRGSLDKVPDFFRMGIFIDSTHMKLLSPSK